VSRSSIILVEVELDVLVPISDENLPFSIGTPPSQKARSVQASGTTRSSKTAWAHILEAE